MFVHLSIHQPKPDRERDLIESMHRFGAAAAGVSGFREAHTLKDLRSGRLIGLAIWEDEESWRTGVEAMRLAVQDDPFEDWEEHDPEGFGLVEV